MKKRRTHPTDKMKIDTGIRKYKEIVTDFLKDIGENTFNLNDKKIQESLAVLIDWCRKEPKPFIKYVLKKKYYWFYDDWWNEFLKNKITLIIAPRHMGKTYFFSVMLPLYLSFLKAHFTKEKWIKPLGTNCALVGSSADQAQENLEEIKELVESNELLRSKMPPVREETWKKGKLAYNKGKLYKLGLGGQLRGKHLDYISIDDILQEAQKLSMDEIKKLVYRAYIPASNKKKGKVVIVGTLFDESDIYHTVMDSCKINKRWNYKIYGVELDQEKKMVYLKINDPEI